VALIVAIHIDLELAAISRENSPARADNGADRPVVLRRPAGDRRRQGDQRRSAVLVEQESPVSLGGLPKPGKLVVTLPDNHLQYALTWYELAGVLVISFVTRAFGSGEQPGGAEDALPQQGISPSL
jgi:cytochrome oxidase assembly protein ShyY1